MGRKSKREARRIDAAFRSMRQFIRSEADRIIAEIKGREVRLDISQEELARRIVIARREAGLKGGGCSLKTIQRMELGRAPSRCGYTRMVRYSEATCQAWLNAYIASECSRLLPEKAVRYEENMLEHNV